MNKVILSGNLIRDIEVKQTASGIDVVMNTIAVRREFKNPNGEYDTDFINFVAYKNQANYLINYAHKGDRAELVGRWNTRSYQNQQGATIYINEVIVESITVFNNKIKENETTAEKWAKENGLNQPPIIEVSEDELPF